MQSEYGKEFEAAQEYYKKLSHFKVKYTKIKSKFSSNTADVFLSSSEVVSFEIIKKLPEIKLAKFDGNPRNWLSFCT